MKKTTRNKHSIAANEKLNALYIQGLTESDEAFRLSLRKVRKGRKL